jgi:hypothetical protein
LTTYVLQREQFIPLPVERVFPFFADAGNLDRITPPWLRFQIVTPQPIAMRAGTIIDYRLRYRGLPVRWQTEIEVWSPNTHFVDRALRSPYALWHHTHRFEPAPGGTRMFDIVRYALPLGPLGRLAHRLFVRRDVEQIFDHRLRTIAALLDCGGFEQPPALARA